MLVAETIKCTECGANLKVAAMPTPGKRIRCPKCGEPFVPQAKEKEEEEEEREEVETRPAVRAGRSRLRDEDEEVEKSPRKVRGRSKGPVEFDGTAGDFFTMYLLFMLLTIITAGLAFPWTSTMLEKWKTEHTLIEGRRLSYNGTGMQLLGLFIVMYFFIIITLGIYMFWAIPKYFKYIAEHTYFADERRRR